jgi:hypothetical protein
VSDYHILRSDGTMATASLHDVWPPATARAQVAIGEKTIEVFDTTSSESAIFPFAVARKDAAKIIRDLLEHAKADYAARGGAGDGAIANAESWLAENGGGV